MNKQFLHSLHWFRGVAIIFVVMSHIPKPLTQSDFVAYIHSLFSNGTFFFVFIAGYLFWHLKQRYQFKKYLITKIKFVGLPYLIVLSFTMLLIIALEYFQIQAVNFNHGISVSFTQPLEPYLGVVWNFLVGGNILVALWFIPFIFLIFISSSLIIKLGNSRYFLLGFMPLLILSIFSFRPLLAETPYFFPVLMFLHFLGIFLLGVFLKKKEAFLYEHAHLFILPSLLLFALFVHLSVRQGFGHDFIPLLQSSRPEHIINYEQLQMLFGVLFFLTLFFYLEKKHQHYFAENSPGVPLLYKILAALGTYSFGIFFLHEFFIKLIRKLHHLLVGDITTATSYFLIGFFVLLLTFLLVRAIVKLLPNKSRYLIGS